jgi:malonate transporter and related proteins
MNISGLVGALLPVFFVLALGYGAGKRHTFDADQAAGLSELALGFALPASLFVGMTKIPKELLLQQGRLVLALILSHDGLFLAAWLLLRRVKSMQGPASIIYALLLATSATPVFGIAVLQPLLGDTSTGTVGLVALAINLVVPAAIILLEMSNPGSRPGSLGSPSPRAQVLAGLKSGLQSVQSPFAREVLVCCSFPLATIVVLLAAKYKAVEAESVSALLSTLSLVVTVPVIIAISR